MVSLHKNVGKCYCEEEHVKITADIVSHAIPVEAFMKTCCWQKICNVRNASGEQVTKEMWDKIVSKRNQLYFNLNPFGQ